MSDDTPKLRKSLLGKVRSDEGWSVKITGPLSIVYSDVLGDVRVGGEARAGGRISFELYTESIDTLPRDRADLVVRRINEAFRFAGWHLRVN